jgi:PPOX class probable F420-dependent enzyme
MTAAQARARFAAARVARLATAGADGAPHLVPIAFAVAGETIVHAVDHKPKRTRALRRLANIAGNPHVSVLADHYEDGDWGRLWWVRVDGTARILASGEDEAVAAIALLRARYAQYEERPPEGPVVIVDVARWTGWTGG